MLAACRPRARLPALGKPRSRACSQPRLRAPFARAQFRSYPARTTMKTEISDTTITLVRRRFESKVLLFFKRHVFAAKDDSLLYVFLLSLTDFVRCGQHTPIPRRSNDAFPYYSWRPLTSKPLHFIAFCVVALRIVRFRFRKNKK